MVELTKLLSVTVVGAVCALLLRRARPDFAVMIGLVAVGLTLAAVLSAVAPVLTLLSQLADAVPQGGVYLTALLKCVGAAVLSGLAADVCTDCGQAALAKTAATAGRVGVLVAALPVFTALTEGAMTLIGL